MKEKIAPPAEDDLKDIRADLTDNNQYSKIDADDIVSLIQNAKLKVVFLEANSPQCLRVF